MSELKRRLSNSLQRVERRLTKLIRDPAEEFHPVNEPIPKRDLILRNGLPYHTISFFISGSTRDDSKFQLRPLEEKSITVENNKQTISGRINVHSRNWTFINKLSSLSELGVLDLASDLAGTSLKLKCQRTTENGEDIITIFSPLCLVNKTDMDLSYLQIIKGDGYEKCIRVQSHHYNKDEYKGCRFQIMNHDVDQVFAALDDDMNLNNLWVRIPLDANAMIDCMNKLNVPCTVKSFVRPNLSGLGKTITLYERNHYVEDETYDDVELDGKRQVRFKNDLFYDVSVAVFNSTELEPEVIRVKAGSEGSLTPGEDSMLVACFKYLGEIWRFESRSDEMWYSSAEFISERGQTIRLGAKWIEQEEFSRWTLFSPIFVFNQTGFDLVYMQRDFDKLVALTNHGAEMSNQPVLLNADMIEFSIALARPNKKLKWVEFNTSERTLKLISGNGITHSIQVEVRRNFNQYGLSVTLSY